MGRTASRIRSWAIELAACLAVGVLLGLVGPFGSFLNDGPLIRVVYWVSVMLLCGLTYGAAIRGLARPAGRLGAPAWAWMPAMVLALSLPLTPVTRLVAAVFWPAIGRSVDVVQWYGQVALVGLVCVGLRALLLRGLGTVKRARPEAPGGPDILRHLPPRLGRDLLCLSMEDHYVRLHTQQGSVLVLMSLNQAMDQLGDLDGLQVHRSWWVARRAVEQVVEDGRNVRLVLRGGIEAPVSRANVARIRSAGWMAG